ncbi:MAG: hypothetical protein ACXACR_12310 [Candidatus Hodarchaeales archaeon]|jgi:hypothetical protein
MPFSPFHFGPNILFFSIFLFLDPLALIVSSVIPDIEGITALYILPQLGFPLHGPFHSFTGAIILGLLTGFGSWLIQKYIPKILEILHIDLSFNLPQYSLRCSLISAFIGSVSHILLDSALYPEMDLLFPFGVGNPWNRLRFNLSYLCSLFLYWSYNLFN